MLRRLSPSGWLSLASFVALGLWTILILLPGGAWWIGGHAHDQMMNLDAGYQVANGRVDRFPTSFGWIYLALQGAAWKLALLFPDREIGRTTFLTGLLFAAPLLMLSILVRRFSLPWLRLPWWAVAALLTCCFTVRAVDVLPWPPFSQWYSLYNHQLWAWWALHLLLTLGWQRRCRAGRAMPEALPHLACLQAALLYVELHYKPNYFGGGLLLLASAMLWMPRNQALRLLALTALMGCLALALTAFAGYDYAIWLIHLNQAMAAKSGAALAVNYLGWFLGIGLAGWICLRMRTEALGLPLHPRGASDCLMLLSALVVSMGNYPPLAAPMLMAVAALLMLGFEQAPSPPAMRATRWSFHHALPWLGGGFLVLQLGLNIWSMGLVLWERRHPPSDPPYAVMDLHGTKGTHWRIWAIAPPVGGHDLTSVTAPQVNRQFVDFMRDGQRLLKALGSTTALRVGSIEMINPFPWLTGMRHPRANLHWIDPGVTMSAESAPGILGNYYAGSDALLLPVYIMPDVPHRLVNCHFLHWNRAHGLPFRLAAETGAAQLFLRRDWRDAERKDPAPLPSPAIAPCPEQAPHAWPKAMESWQ